MDYTDLLISFMVALFRVILYFIMLVFFKLHLPSNVTRHPRIEHLVPLLHFTIIAPQECMRKDLSNGIKLIMIP